MASASDYIWGTGLVERKRLLEQTELYVPEANWLLDHLQIKTGTRAIDLGCGPLGILDLLSARVGSQGEVMGIEWEAGFVELAKVLIAERALGNVTVRCGDAAATGFEENSFSFVHTRLLLIVVPEPQTVISEMVRLAEPGGTVVVEDVDVGVWSCEPPHPAWTRLFQAFLSVYSRDGKDVRIGRRLPALLRAAGLENIGFKAHTRLNRPGDFHQQQLLVFLKLFWRQIIELELIGEKELGELFRQLERHLSDPNTLVVSPMLFQAWGSKKR